MNDQENRESIQALSDLIDCGGFRLGSELDYNKALRNARSILTSYLSITEPREKKRKKPTIAELEKLLDESCQVEIKPNGSLVGGNITDIYDEGYNDGYNQALKDCKLYHLKQMEGLEEVIRDSKLYQGFQCKDYVIRMGLLNQLATAIRQKLGGIK